MNIKNTFHHIEAKNSVNSQQEPDLDAAIEALQAVVISQKAQIDALLASMEGLLAALNSSASPLGQGWAQPLMAQAMQKSLEQKPAPVIPSATLLGNPLDPQFAPLHQLMQRLKLG